ncbi:hypothetical protein [Pseudoflavonifractor phocaeensis]|uniref:hypothetical protein n=1 Tax=Pseudoflavonifractor phocaeensis TaxID=1870988 RepID=UPI00195C0316|nr:hypothetical protein [Pseudoflavonifractor phocaeensis]MBM6725057.1 hypothetical protein [Pseudoflavonifractor phocaeensis]
MIAAYLLPTGSPIKQETSVSCFLFALFPLRAVGFEQEGFLFITVCYVSVQELNHNLRHKAASERAKAAGYRPPAKRSDP